MSKQTQLWKKGLSWKEIIGELDSTDNSIEQHNKDWKDPKFRNHKMAGMSKGKLRHEVCDEWNECSFHEIKHRGVAGGCPLCMLRTMFEEKQTIGERGY